MPTLLDDFLTVCRKGYLVYDTLSDAQEAARWLMKGRKEATSVLIVAADADVPDDLLESLKDGSRNVIRARDIIDGNWFVVTREGALP